MLLLKECFRDLSWLATVWNVGGEVGLLVTSVVPQTPFFWAMHITEVPACWWPSVVVPFSPSLPGVSVVTGLAGVASRKTLLLSRSLSHLVIPLVPLGQMSGAGAAGDTCRDKYGVIQAVTHCVCGIPRPCRRTCRRCLVPWPWPRSNSPTCSLQSCSAGRVAWPSITWAITGGPGTGVCQAGPLLPSSRLWILSCSFLSGDL